MKIKEGGGMGNPEKIEIEGLKTIHKLCKFGADHNMEGCTFTEIVERMFSKIEQMKTQVNTLDEMLLNQGEALAQAKAQAVPEGFVLVPEGLTHEQAARISDDENFFETYQTILTESDTSEDSAVILIQTAHKAMIKAQEPAND